MNKLRQPTLADKLLAAGYNHSAIRRDWIEKRMDNLRVAKKFVLDTQAATYLGQMVAESPRVIADAQDFAIQPFERMWIELPFKPYFKAVTGTEPDYYSDTRVGYLFQGPLVHVGLEGTWKDSVKTPDVGILPVEYQLHRPMPEDEQLKLVQQLGISRLQLNIWFWGESAKKFMGGIPSLPKSVREAMRENPTLDGWQDFVVAQGWDDAGLKALRDNHTARIPPIYPNLIPRIGEMVQGSSGDLRNIIALLLFINRTADIRCDEEKGMAHTIIERKPRPMLPHTVITLKLNPLPRLRTLSAGLGVRRRLHDVRGHFCHDRTARNGCPHGEEHEEDFGEWWDEYKPLQWKCKGCGGRRWWRHEHKRGHVREGVIKEQRYAVTK